MSGVRTRTPPAAPVGSAEHADRVSGASRRGRRPSHLDRLEPGVRRGVRRLYVLVALLPLLVLLAHQAPRLLEQPFLLGYGMAVLAATIVLFYLAYSRYDDPCDPRFSRVPDDAGAPRCRPPRR